MSECSSFLKLNNILLSVWTIFCLPICLLMDTWVASPSWLLRFMLLWTWVYKYLFQPLLLNYFDYIHRSGVAEQYGNSMFDFVKNHCTVLHSSCTISHSHQQCARFYLVHILTNACSFLLLFVCFVCWQS